MHVLECGNAGIRPSTVFVPFSDEFRPVFIRVVCRNARCTHVWEVTQVDFEDPATTYLVCPKCSYASEKHACRPF